MKAKLVDIERQRVRWQGAAVRELVINDLAPIRGLGHVYAPQQQPCVDQRQGQQQPLQAVGMAHPGQFQAKPAPIVLEILKHLFDPEPLLVTATGPLTSRFRGEQIPGLSDRRRPVQRQMEATDRMFLREREMRPEAALAGQQKGQQLKIGGSAAADILVGAQAQAHAPAVVQRPLRQYTRAKLPIPRKRTSARRGSHRATIANSAFCSAKLDTPGPSIPQSKGQARPRYPTQIDKRFTAPPSVRSMGK